jgi:putative ABC transport system ATP-binding protein
MERSNRAKVFSARGLTKVYAMGETEVHALRGIDLDLFEGEFVVLLGPSGSGKSTLLNILGGLDAASAGEVHYRDHDLVQASDAELTRFRREHVGFVFQFYNLIPSLNAGENVALVTDLVDQAMTVERSLALVGLAERSQHFPSQLSGGEQQRIAIARAVAKCPDILLCDEPTGALDFETAKLVLQTILDINAQLGTLIVVITHNAAIAGLADRVVYLANGRITRIVNNAKRLAVADIIW